MSKWQDEQVLREMYIEQNLTQREIARQLGCSNYAVYRWMKKHGIPTQGEGCDNREDTRYRDEEFLRQQYFKKDKTVSEIADECDCSNTTVQYYFDKHGIETKRFEKAIKSFLKKPAQHYYRDGYEMAANSHNGKTDRVRIHRLVAVAEHGIDSVIGKHVHHKNEIPWDNRPDNLEIMTPSEHTAHHKPVLKRWE